MARKTLNVTGFRHDHVTRPTCCSSNSDGVVQVFRHIPQADHGLRAYHRRRRLDDLIQINRDIGQRHNDIARLSSRKKKKPAVFETLSVAHRASMPVWATCSLSTLAPIGTERSISMAFQNNPHVFTDSPIICTSQLG